MKASLKFIKYRLSHPQFIDFVDQGLGIEARAKRCQKYWAKHLEFSRRFIKVAAEESQAAQSVAILGAGRLYDVQLESLMRYKKISLVDADPSCKGVWQHEVSKWIGPKYEFNITDLTGSIQNWTEELTQLLKSGQVDVEATQIADFLHALKINSEQGMSQTADLLISINLLSQIPIYWRDRLAKLLLKHARLDSDENGKYSKILQTALDATFKRLQSDHLTRLAKLAQHTIVLITDRYFHYYQKDKVYWQSEPALYINDYSELPNWHLERQESWLWHIAPQDIEQPNFGIIHEVQASFFKKPS